VAISELHQNTSAGPCVTDACLIDFFRFETKVSDVQINICP